ncbi:MAG: hypothetical protein RBS39_12445 [Phycisphaerales bacterium]|jgi:hypothetical protein|nr:hypothetical protein [Phycisphaerales bacterium]
MIALCLAYYFRVIWISWLPTGLLAEAVIMGVDFGNGMVRSEYQQRLSRMQDPPAWELDLVARMISLEIRRDLAGKNDREKIAALASLELQWGIESRLQLPVVGHYGSQIVTNANSRQWVSRPFATWPRLFAFRDPIFRSDGSVLPERSDPYTFEASSLSLRDVTRIRLVVESFDCARSVTIDVTECDLRD